MDWQEVIKKIEPHIVKIRSPRGAGTGFLCFEYPSKTHYGIATALHVVSQAHEWQEPLQIIYSGGQTVFYTVQERTILLDNNYDSSVIVVPRPEFLDAARDFVPFFPIGDILATGSEVGWMGYPAVDPGTLCFFSGSISARKSTGYFIDGVSINGISGGPVFHKDVQGNVKVLGIVTEYHANRSIPGQALPGLMYAHDATKFNEMIANMNADYAEWLLSQRAKPELEDQVAGPIETPTLDTAAVAPNEV